MIDSISYLNFVLLSIGCSQIFASLNPLYRLFWCAFPGIVLIYAIDPLALVWALICFSSTILLFAVSKKLTSNRTRAFLPYALLIFLFIPDLMQFAVDTPVLYFGAAFFVIRQMMTLAESVKQRLTFIMFVPSLLLGTFFFAALPSGPVYSGVDVWRQLKQQRSVDYQYGLWRLFEGFVCLFALAGFANMAVGGLKGSGMAYASACALSSSAFIICGMVQSLLIMVASFCFLFSTFYGYSRMAEGAAMLLGFTVPENFDRPHLAVDLSDFWKRWHRSMAGFVMQYIYLPLLVSFKNAKVALVCAFLFMGLWHKFSLGFMVWGLGHGLGIAYFLPWLKNITKSAVFIRMVSLSYILILSSLAHEVFV